MAAQEPLNLKEDYLNLCTLVIILFFIMMLLEMIRRIVVFCRRRRDPSLAQLMNNNDFYIPAGVPLNVRINIIAAGTKRPKATPPPSNGNA